MHPCIHAHTHTYTQEYKWKHNAYTNKHIHRQLYNKKIYAHTAIQQENICTHILTCIHASMHTHTHAHTHTHTHTHTYTHIYIYIYITYTHLHTYICHTYTQKYKCKHMHTQTNICTHSHTTRKLYNLLCLIPNFPSPTLSLVNFALAPIHKLTFLLSVR